MHPEADAFLDAIFDNPGDDTPRLVFADWLQEHGQENYAQFIRLQCAAAREKLWSDEANRLWEEIGRVWSRLDAEWWPATRAGWRVGRHPGDEEYYPKQSLDAIHFDRGFLRPQVHVESNHVIECDACWPWLPTPVTSLELWPNSNLETLATAPTLQRVRSIWFCYDWDDYEGRFAAFEPPHLDTLLRSPHLCRLRELNLERCGVSPSNVLTLLTAPNLVTVESVRLWFHTHLWDGELPGTIPDRERAISLLKKRFKVGAYWPDPPV